ncbi:MAG: DciA family protein [Acidobacteriota bacterium]
MEKIVAAFPKILKQLEINPEAREAFVFAAWRRCIGDGMNEQTAPVELDDTRLKIAVSNETWRRHLVDMSGEILFKLNSRLAIAQVTFLDFFVNRAAVVEDLQSNPIGRRSETAEVEEALADEVRESAEAIEDDGLRDAFINAAGSCLARSKRNLGR